MRLNPHYKLMPEEAKATASIHDLSTDVRLIEQRVELSQVSQIHPNQ